MVPIMPCKYYILLWNLFPLIPAALGSPLRRPVSTSWPPPHAGFKRLQRRPPSPIAIAILHIFSHVHIKRWRCIRGRLRQWSQIISAHVGDFQSRIHIRQNCLVLVEFRTSFFRVLTCFNGCAAAMDARLGFGTRLRWFCDRGVWWKRTFWGKFGSGNDVDLLLILLDWDVRCQQWFEWRWQRFCCDVPDSNDSLTSRSNVLGS